MAGVPDAGPEGAGQDGGPLTPVMVAGGASSATGPPRYPGVLRSVPLIDLAAAGHGVLSNDADGDGVFRHLALISSLAGRLAPNLSLETYRLAARAPWISVYPGRDGRSLRGVGVGTSSFPTERDGRLWIDFTPRDEWPVISSSDVLSGKIPPGAFDGRLVMLGITALGQVDQLRLTPREQMSGVEINAQGLENLLAGQLARRPDWAALGEPALTLGLGLFLILTVPGLRGGWRAAAAVLPLVLLAVTGGLLWQRSRLLVDVVTPALGCGLVCVAMLGGGLAEADTQRRRLRRELEVRRLAAARAEGELEAARRIQMGILPAPGSLPADPRFDLFAVMEPARQIGGDLYDFFKVDDDHLFVAVGDVSGKGLPAALFMALGKSLCKSCALRGETDIGAIVRRADDEISRDNPEMLFITLFAAILDLRTGALAFCNAGHDTPVLLRPGAPPQAVPCEGGPPLCVAEGFPYATEWLQLRPGDLLCLTTDGVTEAMTAAGVLWGREPAERQLSTAAPDDSARSVALGLQAAVARFVDGAEPSDDLTILTLRWRGP